MIAPALVSDRCSELYLCCGELVLIHDREEPRRDPVGASEY